MQFQWILYIVVGQKLGDIVRTVSCFINTELRETDDSHERILIIDILNVSKTMSDRHSNSVSIIQAIFYRKVLFHAG